jgi:hypothetical protein
MLNKMRYTLKKQVKEQNTIIKILSSWVFLISYITFLMLGIKIPNQYIWIDKIFNIFIGILAFNLIFVSSVFLVFVVMNNQGGTHREN